LGIKPILRSKATKNLKNVRSFTSFRMTNIKIFMYAYLDRNGRFLRGIHKHLGSELQVPGESDAGKTVDKPLARVPLIPLDAVAIVVRKFVMIAVIPFAVGEDGAEPVVFGGRLFIITVVSHHVREGVNKEGRIHNEKHSEADRDHEDAERTADPETDRHGKKDPAHERPDVVILVLVHDELVLEKVRNVVLVDVVLVKNDPVDMAVPETASGVIRVEVRIRKLMVLAVLGRPLKSGLLVSRGAEEKEEETEDVVRFISRVREEPVIARSDRKAGREEIKPEKGDFRRGHPLREYIDRRPDHTEQDQYGK